MSLIHTVIITYQRPKELERALKCLVKASEKCKDFEYATTVLINGPDASAEAILTNHPGVAVLKSSERLTPAGARLEILKTLPVCDWIYFSDDDAFVPEEFFLNFSKLKNLNFDVFGGPNLTPAEATEFQKLSGEILGNPWVTNKISYRYARRAAVEDCDEGHLILCNLFLRFGRLKDFSLPGLWPGGEENKAIKDLIKRGGRCYYSPDLFVFHERRGDLKSFNSQMFKYGMGRGLNLKLYQGILILAFLPFNLILHLIKYIPFPNAKLVCILHLYSNYLAGIYYGVFLKLKLSKPCSN